MTELRLWRIPFTAPPRREQHYGQADHVRLYGRDYPQRLREAGFHVGIVDYYHALPEHERTYYALRAEDTIYLGGKSPLPSTLGLQIISERRTL